MLIQRARLFADDVRRGGLSFALRSTLEWATRTFLHRSAQRLRTVRVKGVRHPIWYRTHTSDLKVIRTVILHQELRGCVVLQNVRHVVDCGANIGMASLWFLEHFPEARVTAIEPDAGNLDVCRRNLAPYADRVRFNQLGIWGRCVPLIVDRHAGDGEAWEFRVRPAPDGQSGEVDGVDLATLFDRESIDHADLVKMDIELAEEQVLASDPHPWLRRTSNLVIELHTPAARDLFDRVIADYHAQRTQTGEYAAAFALRPRLTVQTSATRAAAPEPLS